MNGYPEQGCGLRDCRRAKEATNVANAAVAAKPGMANFSSLPYEIRSQIWALTVSPRIVKVRVEAEVEPRVSAKQGIAPLGQAKEPSARLHLVSSTPVPPVLQICRESRDQHCALYEKLFLRDKTEKTYVWVDFDADIIDIGREDLEHFKYCGHHIRRLKFEAENTSECWYRITAKHLVAFKNVIQYFIVAGDGWGAFEDAYNEHFWACVPEELYIIDKDEWRMMTFPEVEAFMEAEEGQGENSQPGRPVPEDLAGDFMYAAERWYARMPRPYLS